ncbi:MAG: protein-glutamate O-methyltransferase CheR [Acidobacteriaceae bacterium]
MSVTPSDFEYVRDLIHQRAGIVLEQGKEYLVESRLGPLAEKEGFGSLAEYLGRLQRDTFNGSHRKLIHAMTTNETLFFRDIRPFELLRSRIIPELIAARASERYLTFWSAACSTGQEPYTIAMTLREYFPQLQGWNLRIIASDLSTDVLARAIRGRYTQLEVNRGLPVQFLVKYFNRDGDDWQIREEIRRIIEFREMNLTEAWSFLTKIDVVFMRNVLIYFNQETKRKILSKVAPLISASGFLFLGSAETTLTIAEEFEPLPGVAGGCYRLKRPKLP